MARPLGFQHDCQYLCPSRLQIQNILGAGHGAGNASSEVRWFREPLGKCNRAGENNRTGFEPGLLTKKTRCSNAKTANSNAVLTRKSENSRSRTKKESPANPWVYWTFLAERMGFEPMCDCSQTDFESAPLWPLRYLSVYVKHGQNTLNLKKEEKPKC